ncbi:MAG: ADP-glyceromanno-heptose 6-epimerase [Rickettsiales bacterium]|nr:ADP-glyceromanno-heptose 6-epimerase [Rickettsiales bacterium]|tara:strand:- start:162 stop:1154 length:993 start_codon:yes stop_codon:yes gene_type:complete
MQRVLVTGGAGFIGSVLANEIADKEDYRAVVCDRFGSTEKWRNLSKHQIFEIISPEDSFFWLESQVENIKAVVHLGAISSTTETDVDLILENNFNFSKQLWNWCAQNEKPFIYASSAATYGNGEQGFNDEVDANYLTSLRPMNAYGWSKLLFDQYVSNSVRRGDKVPPQWVGLKFFNVYGPNEYHKGGQKSVAAQIFPHAAAGRPVKLFKSYNKNYPDGGQKRDFVYVKDCTKVMRWFLEHPEKSGLFNLGTGEARTFEDLAKAVFTALKREPKISFVDMPEEIKEKYQYLTEAKMNRLREAGYKHPFHSLEEGITDYVQQHLNQADPYF